MNGPIISLQKLTAPAAIVIASAWVTRSNGLADGIGFLIATGGFYILLVLIEQAIFADNVHHLHGIEVYLLRMVPFYFSRSNSLATFHPSSVNPKLGPEG